MSKYLCSYAYDISCYRDFVIEAESEEQAEEKLQAALKAGKFENANGSPEWGQITPSSERVFVMGQAADDAQCDDLDNL